MSNVVQISQERSVAAIEADPNFIMDLQQVWQAVSQNNIATNHISAMKFFKFAHFYWGFIRKDAEAIDELTFLIEICIQFAKTMKEEDKLTMDDVREKFTEDSPSADVLPFPPSPTNPTIH